MQTLRNYIQAFGPETDHYILLYSKLRDYYVEESGKTLALTECTESDVEGSDQEYCRSEC